MQPQSSVTPGRAFDFAVMYWSNYLLFVNAVMSYISECRVNDRNAKPRASQRQ
jgi:hypothetical protein